MRDDYRLRLLVERLQRDGLSERAIERAVREVIRDDERVVARSPHRGVRSIGLRRAGGPTLAGR